jgi:predicted nucleic acid-binding protein
MLSTTACFDEATGRLRVLRDKFRRTPEWLAENERQVRVIACVVVPTESLRVIEADPTDDRVLECAVAARVQVIVSGDTHLLSLGSFRRIRIQRVAEFLSD